ncbi:MAG: amidohydrolase family protein [Paludibacteraceae bacterium]|nr:amidohydrolase family protein [Paludibacteraceae bacterium]
MRIYKAQILFTKERTRFEVMPDGYIAVENGTVIGVYEQLPASLAGQPVTDFGDKLLIPAMNDIHVHAPQYRNLGIAMDLELLPWLDNYTFPEESKYSDTEYAERMYRRFVRDLWRFGTMRTVAFATVHRDSTRLLMNLFLEAGMGARVGKVDMNRNCPETLCQSIEDAVRDNEALIAEYAKPDALVSPIITPRFVPSCTPEMLQACGELAHKYNLPVQSHLSENRNEIAWVQDLEPESRYYGDAYRQYGLFGDTPTIMAHCVWTDGDELALMRDKQVMVAHCPTSNLNLASGMAPIRKFLNEGVPVGLGSDISGGHDLSIFKMIVYAIQISKMRYCQDKSLPFLTLPEAFWIATKSAGRFFGQVGSFEPGYEFDALVIDDSELNHDNYSLLHRLERFIYLGDDRQIIRRFCRGQEISEPKI